jgi:UPF0755 protein
MAKGKRVIGRVLIIALLILGAVSAIIAYRLWLGPALKMEGENKVIYIKTGSDHQAVYGLLAEAATINHPEMLQWLMERKNYRGDNIVPGKYTISDDMSSDELIDHLRAGNGEEEVQIVFNTARTFGELAAKASANIEADSAGLAALLRNPKIAQEYGFTPETFISMFLPDTYRAEWDTDAGGFVQRMAGEYKKFWTEERKRKAAALNLSQSDISTLASIVQAEQQIHPDERAKIAGLYLNRLRRGMRLQSDPTVVYAMGDFSINRVLTKHLSTPSPYNTYLNAGLPPGPINIPSKQAINSVLNPADNNHLYMCAKPDFSGYHAFASNLSAHNRNARAFQRALNEREIYR